ncbi:helix-turn-helix domain-containing protein [Roseibium polysiphoniae]
MFQLGMQRQEWFGPTLRRWRMLNRVKQSSLAAEMGVSQTTVSRWESGRLVPEGAHAQRLERLLSARPKSSADHALSELVETSRQPAHLICDFTHRLLAASAGRLEDWRVPLSDKLGTSLWRYATEGIRLGEAGLAARGWMDAHPPEVTVLTERMDHRDLTIRAGEIIYTRIALSDGSFARLVRDGARQKLA